MPVEDETRQGSGAAQDANRPLGSNEFSALLNDLSCSGQRYKPAALAVAVSGGADSMALCLLAARWSTRHKIPFHALTVDHGLRRGSGVDAKAVAQILKQLGIRHSVLKWWGEKPTANIQATARQARYDLLTGWCIRHGVPDLLLAHHLNDQAETVLLRLIRGSGVDGLAAMSGLREMAGVRLLRPLLSVPANRLRLTCRKAGLTWIEDPSNQNAAFSRIKVRTLLADLVPLGLEAGRLAQTARHMARARQALEYQTNELAQTIVSVDSFGVAEIEAAAFRALPEEMALRLLSRCLRTVGGGSWPARFERLERLYNYVRDDASKGQRTLAGCKVSVQSDLIRLIRENRHLPEIEIKPGREQLWDNRFRVCLSLGKGVAKTDLVVGPLGSDGWKSFCVTSDKEEVAKARVSLGRLPVAVCYGLPAVRQKGVLVALPWAETASDSAKTGLSMVFSPRNPLIHESFTVVSPAKDIIY